MEAAQDFLKRLSLWFYMQVIGAITVLREQTWDRHRPLKREYLTVSRRHFLPPLTSFLAGDLLNQDGRGKTVVMTGGNRGIGWEALKTMLPLGYHFILGEN